MGRAARYSTASVRTQMQIQRQRERGDGCAKLVSKKSRAACRRTAKAVSVELLFVSIVLYFTIYNILQYLQVMLNGDVICAAIFIFRM